MAVSAAKTRFLREFPESLHDGSGTVFIGAGVSVAAGYPSWSELLRDIGEEIGVNSRDILDLAALAQWHIRETGNAAGVRNVIRREIGRDRPLPDVVQTLARLPMRHIWTTNYDRLIERAFSEIGRPIVPISGGKDLALKTSAGATRLYKMHGSVDRLDDIVISTDDYELYRRNRGAFLPLLQAHLSSMSMLFVGLSLTDPNIRHVLSLIRESFTEAPPEHFAILKPPRADEYKTEPEFKARLAQHRLWAKDLGRYGLVAVEVEDYDEVPELLRDVERRVAARRVWVSGSWPLDGAVENTARVYELAEALGQMIGENNRDLVTGTGLLVGPAVVSGFMSALRTSGGWDIDRRLIARPFPQPIPDRPADKGQWTALRGEMARLSGVTIFLGGLKIDNGSSIVAEGVLEEFALAQAAGSFVIPIGAFGGAAEEIARQLTKSAVPSSGSKASRPNDGELEALSNPRATVEQVVGTVRSILNRLAKAS
ncbi:SIR2 family protein (plasmid) [Agrobacterium fabrum]|uniref:SIR2 family protein n=1 Tax=Agrobacterium fabrum TaxID=1176649 RepID=UPI0021D13D7B|nr:SIR2 family protein [Agrobacterium fabrum]UXT61384.1 SIR2 family protein [Agrobacterium fabrum]